MCQANYSNRYYSQKEMKHFRTHILDLCPKWPRKIRQEKKLNYIKITRYSQRSHLEKWLDIHKRFQVGKYSQIVYIRKKIGKN